MRGKTWSNAKLSLIEDAFKVVIAGLRIIPDIVNWIHVMQAFEGENQDLISAVILLSLSIL